MDAIAGLLDGPRPARPSCCARAWTRRGRCASGRGAADRGRVVRGEAWVILTTARPSLCAAATSRSSAVRSPTPSPTTRPPRPRSSSSRASCARRRPGPSRADGRPRCPHLGQRPDGATVMLTGTYELDGEVSGRLLARSPARSSCASAEWELSRDPADGRRDRQGRARPGGRARPPARPAADRRSARLVRPAGGGAPGGTGPTATRSSATRCACCTTIPPASGPSPRSRTTGVRAPRSPGASTSSSASRP